MPSDIRIQVSEATLELAKTWPIPKVQDSVLMDFIILQEKLEKLLHRGDFLEIKCFATLLENSQVVLVNSNKSIFSLTTPENEHFENHIF